MKYITLKTSETGKKFMACYEKMIEASIQAKELAISLGAKEWRPLPSMIAIGGISSLIFDNVPDRKIWKNVYGTSNEWMPKLNTKEGRLIHSLIESLPNVPRREIGRCIGFDSCPYKGVGFEIGEGAYIGFSVMEEWNVQVPDDCEEVTTTRYNVLLGKEVSND